LIFSKRNDAWGSFYYDPAEDILRVSIKHQTVPTSEEWLKYEFTARLKFGQHQFAMGKAIVCV
jgi:hypothetical protein